MMQARIGQSETVWTWLLWPSSWFIMRTGQSERDCCSHHSSRQRAGRRAEHQDSDSAATWIPARVEPAQAERSRPRPAQAEGLLIGRDLASGPLRLKGSELLIGRDLDWIANGNYGMQVVRMFSRSFGIPWLPSIELQMAIMACRLWGLQYSMLTKEKLLISFNRKMSGPVNMPLSMPP